MGLLFNTVITVFSSLGTFLSGYDSGIIASIIVMDHYIARFGNDPNIKGAVVSVFSGGAFFGAAVAGWANDKWGRKRCIQIGCLFALWAGAMQAGANHFATLLVGRIIGGFAIGILSMTVPLYNTEIAPPKIRGFLVGVNEQMSALGFVVANWVGYGSQFIDSDISWRLPLALQMVPAAFLLAGIQLLPYSPRWLLEVGRDEEAREVVYNLHGHDRLSADTEFTEMHVAIKAELAGSRRKLSDLWVTRAMRRRTLVAVGIRVFTQFTGVSVIGYYGPQIYTSLGLGTKALLLQGINGPVGPLSTLIFIIFIIDRVGRKKPLMFGAFSLVVIFSSLAAILATNSVDSPNASIPAQRAGIAMIFLLSVSFSMSFGPIGLVLASEVFPTKTRSIGTCVAACANWASNILIAQVAPLALARIQWKFFLVFVCVNVVNFFIIGLFFPETKCKSLEEMNKVFGDEVQY